MEVGRVEVEGSRSWRGRALEGGGTGQMGGD